MIASIHRHTPENPFTYGDLHALQLEVAARVRAGGEGALLLAEVAPVITCGRRTEEGHFWMTREELRSKGVDLLEVGRGGKVTYHGPGQWVLFLVDDLERLTGQVRGVKRAVCMLLKIAQDTAREFGVESELGDGERLGVWTLRGKLASVGVQVDQGVLLHGMALNVIRTPESFLGIHPCGLDAKPDFLGAEFEEVGRVLVAKASQEYKGKFLKR